MPALANTVGVRKNLQASLYEMGNKKSSSSLDPRYHAKWTSKSECSHSREDYRVTEIRWIEVRMSSKGVKGAAEVGIWTVRILTLGLSTLADNGKNFTHECLEILYKCERCGESGRFTTEILGKHEKEFECGYYRKQIRTRNSYKPSSMTVAYAKRRFDEMGSSYNFVTKNCYHWCRRLWDKL